MTNRPPPTIVSAGRRSWNGQLKQANGIFLVSRIKKAPDIAVLGQAACSY
jgi:hypothetical protein